MINHEEIKNLVTEWNIREDVIEKDYIIGWVLWGIGQDPDLSNKWIFKGGTCLKKCYLETYRFSEDLDFTVLPDGPIKPEEIIPIINRILLRINEESGINFSIMAPKFKQGETPFYTEGSIYYQGPRNAPNPARIKLDLLSSEQVVRPPVLRPIVHNYSDKIPEPVQTRCYSLEEIFAEKIRAMGERCRPRDLYDIIFLFRNGYFQLENNLVKSVLVSKCETKKVAIPTIEQIKSLPGLDELRGEWKNMLGHQLPALPPYEEFWGELLNLFNWLEGKYTPEELESPPIDKDKEKIWELPPVAWIWGKESPLESIRFAAVNHLCIQLGYDGTTRIIEPYSLRQTKEGNILVYGIRTDSRAWRSYSAEKIENIEVTTIPFKPVYQIEFFPKGTIYVPVSVLNHINR